MDVVLKAVFVGGFKEEEVKMIIDEGLSI